MKKHSYILVTFFFTLFFTANAYAQMDEREPGLYAIVGEQSIPLPFSNGTTSVGTTGILGVEVGRVKCAYRKPTSGVNAADTFVMVIDPERKAIVKKLKSYNPFYNKMTPNNVLVLPLTVDGKRRIYEEGKIIAGINVSIKDRMDFEWEQITDNSFEIRVQQLIPGEYGFVFRASKLAEFDYSALFGFTIPE